MCVEIIVAIIGILGSIVAGFIAYYKTKKLRFFDAYFENKVRAYNDFWIVVSELRESPHNSETRGNLRTGLYRLGMFSNEDVFKKSQDFGAILLTYSIEPGLSVELEKRADDLMQAMRKDIDNCKKFHFR